MRWQPGARCLWQPKNLSILRKLPIRRRQTLRWEVLWSGRPIRSMIRHATQRQAAKQSQSETAIPVNPDAKRIRELEESIAILRREADSISGLFGFVKRNGIKKEIEVQQRELDSLRRRR